MKVSRFREILARLNNLYDINDLNIEAYDRDIRVTKPVGDHSKILISIRDIRSTTEVISIDLELIEKREFPQEQIPLEEDDRFSQLIKDEDKE